MRLRFAAAIALVTSVTACPSSKSPGSGSVDAGTTAAGLVGRSCSVDAECGALRCDAVRRHCICLSDADCPGQFCNNFTGLCTASVAGCTSDAACGAGQYCNPDTRACAPVKAFCGACAANVECGGANACIIDASLSQSFCGRLCSADADCPHGATCQTLGGSQQCWPAPGSNCKTFTGCNPDALKSCNTQSDCDGVGTDQVCDPGQGRCVAREQICPLGTVCDPSARVCVTACTVDQDCGAPGLKCVNRACQKLAACVRDTDCPADKVCNVPPGASAGECAPFCSADSACPIGFICLPTAESDGTTRNLCMSGCASNGDCPIDQICADANQNPIVPGNGALGTCSTTLSSGAQACQATDACGACDLCDLTRHACQSAAPSGYCASCNPSASNSCAAYGAQATCLSLHGRDPNGAILGGAPYFCGVPCPASGCPKGFVCAALTDSSGQNTGVYNCVPSDFDCQTAQGQAKCQ